MAQVSPPVQAAAVLEGGVGGAVLAVVVIRGASKGLDEAWAKRYYRLLGGVEARWEGSGVGGGRLVPTNRLGRPCSNPWVAQQ